MIICNKTYNGDQFTWNGIIGVVDASELCDGGNLEVDARVYDDACDTGFWVVSHKTARKILFTFYCDSIDRDGDLRYALYKAAVPVNGLDISIRVYND